MVCRHDKIPVLLDEPAPDVVHNGFGAEEPLISRGTAKKDNLGLYELELLSEQRLAGMDLLGCGTPVLRRTALCDIADMVVVISKTIASQKVLEELAGSSDKRKALDVLALTGRLADYHQRGFPAASVDDDIIAAVP